MSLAIKLFNPSRGKHHVYKHVSSFVIIILVFSRFPELLTDQIYNSNNVIPSKWYYQYIWSTQCWTFIVISWCCRTAYQIARRHDNLNNHPRGFRPSWGFALRKTWACVVYINSGMVKFSLSLYITWASNPSRVGPLYIRDHNFAITVPADGHQQTMLTTETCFLWHFLLGHPRFWILFSDQMTLFKIATDVS